MYGKALVVAFAAVGLIIPAGPAVTRDDERTVTAAAIDPETGKIPGFTYGTTEYNTYPGWSGTFIWTWSFAAHHIGYGPSAPVAGVPFYLHAHVSVVSPTKTGNVLITIDQDAGGLPIRYAPTATMPLRCSRGQFDPVQSRTDIPCRDTVALESGQLVVTKLEPLVPGFSLDVEIPVVVDSPTTGTAAMTAMWVSEDASLSNDNMLATVPVSVAPNPNPTPIPAPTVIKKPLPKKLKKYDVVRSRTPKVCSVKKIGAKRVVLVRKKGLCKLRGSKGPGGRTLVVKIRY